MKTLTRFPLMALLATALWVGAGTGGAEMDALKERLDELHHRYLGGHISAQEFERLKFEAREQQLADLRQRYYQGHISEEALLESNRQTDREYAATYSPLTRRELAELQPTLAPPAAMLPPPAGLNPSTPAPTGSPTGREYPPPPKKSKIELLDELLRRYQGDKITPHQYQEERARILALPDR
ncbi:MAG: hypothetical protein ACYDH9_15075 [Limisphaerales bacterium]